MKQEIERAAWQDKPAPEGLSEIENVQYIMLKQMYSDFKAKNLKRKQGESIKQKIDCFLQLDAPDKAMLLEYFIPKLEHQPESVKALSWIYWDVTDGNREYIENTTLGG